MYAAHTCWVNSSNNISYISTRNICLQKTFQALKRKTSHHRVFEIMRNKSSVGSVQTHDWGQIIINMVEQKSV